jgi:hypothetical protein
MSRPRLLVLTWYALAAFGSAALAATVLAVWPAGAAAAVPYTDAQSTGAITLFDRNGQQITHGSISAHPFVSRAVSSVRAPSPYDADGRKATLLAYQPRPGAAPTEWSGDTLTASTTYPDPAHPTATASARDFSLKDYLDTYPARWDGLVQLRLYLGAPNQPTLTRTYATTDIRVDGDTWSVVRAGTAGSAAGGASAAAGSGATGAGASNSTVDGDVAAGQDPAAVNATKLPTVDSPHVLVESAAAIVGVVALGLVRRRRATPAGPPVAASPEKQPV